MMLLLPLLAAAQYRFDSWTIDNGLPQNTVYAVTQTLDGYIWFTTSDGLVRFDGVKFKVFNKSNSHNFPTNRLRHVLAAKDGTLWISTENAGLMRYQNGVFHAFSTADGLPSDVVFEVQQERNGSLLILTGPELIRTRDGGATFIPERRKPAAEYKIYSAPSGTIWEIDTRGLSATEPGGTIRKFSLPFKPQVNQFEETYDFLSKTSLFEDEDRTLWISAENRLFRLKDREFTEFDSRNGLPSSRIRAIARDGAGDLWIGTEKDGACRLSAERFTCFDTSHGISSNNVAKIFLDGEKTLWLTTENAGINRVTRQIIEPFSAARGLSAVNVYPILEDRSRAFWIGSFGALAKIADGKVVNYTKQGGLVLDYVQALFEDRDGKLWVGSIGGVQKFENGRFVDFTETLGLDIGDPLFWDIHQSADGAMWFATATGLLRYFEGSTTRFTTADGLPADDVKVIHEARDGSLWLGTTGGAARYSDDRFVSFTEKEGLAGNFVRSIYEDEDGLLWFGTYDSGLSLFRDGKFTRITAENGLFSNGVFAILPDDNGNFWMSSNQGIYRVSRRQLIDFADGKVPTVTSTAYGKSDGMLSTECNGGRQPAAIRARDGRLWFATQDGAAIVDPNAVPFNPLPPPVVIEDVLIEQKPMDSLGSGIVLQPGQGNLQINYTGLSFIKPEQMRFRYKLEGLDEDWTDAANRRSANYQYLPPGNYVFRVMAANSDNVWSERSADIAVQVLPPFYRQWWFIALAVLGIGGLAFVAYRRRIEQLERSRLAQEEFSRRLINAHEVERRRIAAELHDSLGQSLAMIKNQAVLGARTAGDPENAKVQFEEISNQSAQAIGEVREIAYNLRPYLLDHLGLTEAIDSMLSKISDVGAIDIEVELDNMDGVFTPETEISIYRVMQESMNNILKHSEASKAKVSIGKNASIVTIRIEDNGRGFDVRRPASGAGPSGFGLLGMSERVKMLGGTHTIESEIGKGTIITIDVKLPENKGGEQMPAAK